MRRLVRGVFGGRSVAPGIFAPPILPDSFGRIVQPVRIRELGEQANGVEKLHRIGLGFAECPQFPGADQNGDVIRASVSPEWRLDKDSHDLAGFCVDLALR
jgi:hypothetical protein